MSIHDPTAQAAIQIEKPWNYPAGLGSVIERWQASNMVRPCLTADAVIGGQTASCIPLPACLSPALHAALRARDIHELYTHQVQAIEAALSRKLTSGPHIGATADAVVIATPTASGKSLCFHLPVAQTMSADPDARAIYLYPTKALARDQEASVRELLRDVGVASGAVVYDGDTPGDARRAARERSGIVITNPDMLHTGILPHHTSWARTLQHLKYIVVDEMHTYRGVFGSHVSHVLARLLRIARFHGSSPMLIGATATIGNPREHAARLFGVPPDNIELVSQSGAPTGSRRFFSFNPPVVNAELGIRASYVKQAVMLANDLVRAKVPTIIFGQSRNNVEVMLRYLRKRVQPEIDPARIQGYRGGYLPEKRRKIEAQLRAGEILCVIATNALELGIDIGDLDAVICAGFPGSIASLWQRFGRAGRRQHQSVALLVTSSAPLDQFLAREPGYVLGAPIEEARIDPENTEVLLQHVKCAAFELPFTSDEQYGPLACADTQRALEFLAMHNVLHAASGKFHWAADAYPANSVSLRSVSWDNVVIVDLALDRVLAEIDWRSAHTMVHEQAIYQHDGDTYQVERFDYENHKAFVRKVEPDYFTDAMTYAQISVLEETDTAALADELGDHSLAGTQVGHGDVALVEKVVGYKKIKFFTHENAGYGDVRLPEIQMHTASFWLMLPESVCARVPQGRAAAIDGLRGLGVAMETVATLMLMCDPRDLGTTLGETALAGTDAATQAAEATAAAQVPSMAAHSVDLTLTRTVATSSALVPAATAAAELAAAHASPKPELLAGRPGYSPTLFLYEHTPSGIGLSERLFAHRHALFARTRQLVAGCACQDGCPACVGPADTSRKAAALLLLTWLTNAQTMAVTAAAHMQTPSNEFA
jgi:DEAD/DEAH box helicase domain-containing protein